ncbi:MAG: hypothetical protein UX86_C0045G0013 [Candidatus Amesbacteria bacterium GW2011_GWC1_47_15]|uniref:Uncharacterized protein n=1 Tax=Candidatus Amesbacteria bacterium GW2011_GWC1_47_15 TaxID=1618364 RepID=A0A0G1U8X2_9BACT|nr:MAG: hypothetical protein UX86_C0045G0013 [Candidatus Amesbacteria bacterium GW2011_GWC1_47_15]
MMGEMRVRIFIPLPDTSFLDPVVRWARKFFDNDVDYRRVAKGVAF